MFPRWKSVRQRGTLNAVANISIIVCCIVAAVRFGVSAYRGSHDPPASRQVSAPVLKPGDHFGDFLDIDFSKTTWTLVVVVRSDCRFCTDSMPFYRSLAETAANHPGQLAMIAASPQPVSVIRDYLLAHDVDVPDVRLLSSSATRVQGTPTLLLVDGARHVRRVWFGFLDSNERNEVVSQVF